MSALLTIETITHNILISLVIFNSATVVFPTIFSMQLLVLSLIPIQLFPLLLLIECWWVMKKDWNLWSKFSELSSMTVSTVTIVNSCPSQIIKVRKSNKCDLISKSKIKTKYYCCYWCDQIDRVLSNQSESTSFSFLTDRVLSNQYWK